jgi:hypothetical protein
VWDRLGVVSTYPNRRRMGPPMTATEAPSDLDAFLAARETHYAQQPWETCLRTPSRAPGRLPGGHPPGRPCWSLLHLAISRLGVLHLAA